MSNTYKRLYYIIIHPKKGVWSGGGKPNFRTREEAQRTLDELCTKNGVGITEWKVEEQSYWSSKEEEDFRNL